MNIMTKEINWYQNPTKKTLIVFGLLWLIGNTLLVLVLTDLFTESPLKVKNIIMMFFMIGSTVSVSHLYIKYFKKNKIEKS
jgi:hypothetical protein